MKNSGATTYKEIDYPSTSSFKLAKTSIPLIAIYSMSLLTAASDIRTSLAVGNSSSCEIERIDQYSINSFCHLDLEEFKQFIVKFVSNSKELEPEYAEILDKNFKRMLW